jgi:hypothetical protein
MRCVGKKKKGIRDERFYKRAQVREKKRPNKQVPDKDLNLR